MYTHSIRKPNKNRTFYILLLARAVQLELIGFSLTRLQDKLTKKYKLFTLSVMWWLMFVDIWMRSCERGDCK